ncbi:hypothetical protein OIV83_005486 [Microbotryomycetes sp. JL201]|nr:hypothetical protein OIV83_005486 [Microbotryomycetes sp. JL201]
MLKAKRDPLYQEGLAIVERQIAAAQRAEGLTKRDIEARTLAKRQIDSVSCGLGPRARSQICRDYITNNNIQLPALAYANCNQNIGRCRLKCPNSYTYSRGTCVKNISNCTPEQRANCPANPLGGVYTCVGADGTCTLICRYGRTPIDGQCIDLKFDPDNCGGQTCPPAYNGIGTPACFNYRCTINCPAGYRVAILASGERICRAN